MTAAKIMDVISRLPGCDGEAGDAVSAVILQKTTQGLTQPRHNWPKSWSSMEDPVVPLDRNLFSHPLAGPPWEKAMWENLFEVRLGERCSNGNAFRTPWKRITSGCGWHKIGWKETKSSSDVEITQQRSRFGRSNIFLWSCVFGLHSKTMPNKQKYCGQLQNHVRFANFGGGIRDITISSKSSFSRTIHHKMDQGLWQTPESNNFV